MKPASLLFKCRIWLAALLLAAPVFNAHAFFVLEFDFNEKWLREDAYNRAMNLARKNLNPVSKEDEENQPDVETDILYTGSLVRVKDDFLSDSESLEQLTRLFPREKRAEARRMFVQIIDQFNQSVERLYKIPNENVATGLIALLGGAYAAYHGQSLPDHLVKPAFLQVAAFLRKKPELFEHKTTQKMNSYQMSVGLGMLLMLLREELKKNPNPEQDKELKMIGATIFKSVLGVAPEQVSFTASGLVFK